MSKVVTKNKLDPLGKKPHLEVRFHLLNGENYKHWQVKKVQGKKDIEVYYYNPNEYQIEMKGCKLVNLLARAKQVHKKQRKNVSGWVRCDEVILRKNTLPVDGLEKLFYNPIVNVHWRRESDDGEFVWDNTEYDTLITQNNQVYVLEERFAA